MIRSVHPLRLVILLLAMLTIGAATWQPTASPLTPTRRNTAHGPVSQFLARHWVYPLPPEGPPPKSYSMLEASLSPTSCGACHRQQYDDWRTSLHSHSVAASILWQFRIMNQNQANHCMRCHAPLAEQKALAALEFHWPNAPSSPAPTYVGPQLFHDGLICAACHVRRHQRFGPPPPPGMPRGDTPGLPHGGFIANTAFQHSRFCATCHQSTSSGRSLDGNPFENTYVEWRRSRFAHEHVTCQSCHMPRRRHLWRGIHDPNMVRHGLRISLVVTRIDATVVMARAVIRSVRIGHDFPTYLVPKVYVILQSTSADERDVHELAHQIIGRSVNLDLTRQLFDTRIPPGGEQVLTARLALNGVPAAQIHLRIDVSPGAHYEHLFRDELDHQGRYDKATTDLLRQALSQTLATRYELVDLVAAIPEVIGHSTKVVAN